MFGDNISTTSFKGKRNIHQLKPPKNRRFIYFVLDVLFRFSLKAPLFYMLPYMPIPGPFDTAAARLIAKILFFLYCPVYYLTLS